MSKIVDTFLLKASNNKSIGLRHLLPLLYSVVDPKKIPFVISVAGTNGKGTSIAALSSILYTNSIKTAVFTSPHIFSVHERMRIDQCNIQDHELEKYIAKLKLTLDDQQLQLGYFETCFVLACMWFSDHDCQIWVLEAGIGGEHDSINAIACDVLLLTQIDYDHCDILGCSLDLIAQQKLGLLRAHSTLICSETKSLASVSAALQTHKSFLFGRDFTMSQGVWRGFQQEICLSDSPPHAAKNIALAVAASIFISERFPIELTTISRAVVDSKLLGRQMRAVLADRVFYFDVAHNPAACQALAGRLEADAVKSCIAIFCCSRSKDAFGCLQPLAEKITEAFSADFGAQMCTVSELHSATPDLSWRQSASKRMLLADAIAASAPGATIVVFGSFKVVAAVMESSRHFVPMTTHKCKESGDAS